MLALSTRCSEEGDSMMVGGEGAEAGGTEGGQAARKC